MMELAETALVDPGGDPASGVHALREGAFPENRPSRSDCCSTYGAPAFIDVLRDVRQAIGRVATCVGRRTMFSEEFTKMLSQAATELQRSPAAFQDPAMQQLAMVLRTLSRELERLNAAIVVGSDGNVLIRGKNVTIDSSGDVTVKASKNLALKGSKIVQN
jgi:hypothetical protein